MSSKGIIASMNKGMLPFVIEVKTDNAGTSTSSQFTIPTTGTGYSYTVRTSEQTVIGATGSTTLTWASPGTYEVQIFGNFPRIFFNNGGDRLKLLKIKQWGGIRWSSFLSSFYGCTNLDIIATDFPILSLVTSLANCFRSCSSLVNSNGSLSNWNTASVISFNSTFQSATSFNQNIGSWNTASVISFNSTFQGATSFNQNIGLWDTSKVTTMETMFSGATSFNQNIGSWNVSSCTNFLNMFNGATSFNNGGSSTINNWSIRTVANVTMGGMFIGATSFNQNIGSWNTSRVTFMQSMFSGATSFNQDISSWNVALVTGMINMFSNATAFNQNLGSWSLNKTSLTMNIIFASSGMSTENYTDTIVGWANYVFTNANTPVNVSMITQTDRTFQNSLSGGANFANAGEARTYLTTATPIGAGWTISGDTVIP